MAGKVLDRSIAEFEDDDIAHVVICEVMSMVTAREPVQPAVWPEFGDF